MSQRLVLELSDEVYAELQQRADAAGLSLTEWIIMEVSRQGDPVNVALRTTDEQEEARQRFRHHAGALSLGYATGADNESIDADLARAYANED